MRRAVVYVLTGLAVFLLAIAGLLRFYVVPSLLVTPLDQFAESFAPGTGTVFDPATLARRRQRRHGRPPHPARRRRRQQRGRRRLGRVGACSPTPTASLINATTDRVAWDRKTGEAVNCCNENVDGVPTKHVGLSYKFPFGSEKKTYQFFDTTAKLAYPMTYKGSETDPGPHRLPLRAAGRPGADRRARGARRPGRLGAAPSVKAPRFYDNTRTVWVEPLSGVIVKGQEKQHQVLRDAAGADAVTLIEVTLTFNETTQKQQADLAKDARSKAALVGTWVPLALLVLAIVCGVLAFVLGRREDDDGGHAGGARSREPAAVG